MPGQEAAQPSADVVEAGASHRRDDQREQQAERLPADPTMAGDSGMSALLSN